MTEVIEVVAWGTVMAGFLYGLYLLFDAAGENGLYAFVPIYNVFVFARIGGNTYPWAAAAFIPIIGQIVLLKLYYDACRSFGMSAAATIVSVVIWWIILPALGITTRHGSTEYEGAFREKAASSVGS